MEQLRGDVDASSINALTDMDIDIWATPEGTAFVDGMDIVALDMSITKLFPSSCIKARFYSRQEGKRCGDRDMGS